MLIKQDVLRRIAAGEVRLAFRCWQRPTVRAGGTLQTAVGVLSIEAVDPIEMASISLNEARQAGYGSLEALLKELSKRDNGDLYRIRLSYAGEDPRIALRQQVELTAHDIEQLTLKLGRLDQKSTAGPWTLRVLQAIAEHPELSAGALAEVVDIPKEKLKTDVRKLKNLGLTESLHPGYRLAPRGVEFLKRRLQP